MRRLLPWTAVLLGLVLPALVRGAEADGGNGKILADLRLPPDQYSYTPEVIYGHKFGMALTYDVFTPKKDANGVGVIFVVSGGWVSDRQGAAPFYGPAVAVMLKRGYTVFTVCHGCQPKFNIDEAAGDLNRSVRFIRSRAADYAISPDRIGISGGSAGGHLSLMQGVAGDLGDPKASDPINRVSSRVQAVGCFFPPTDFLNYGGPGKYAFARDGVLAPFRTAADFQSFDSKTLRFERITDEAKVLALGRKISPIDHITADTPPTLIIHGDADKLVPIEQSQTFLAKLSELGVPTKLIVKKGAGHGWPGLEKDMPPIADWFDKYLAKK